MMARQQAGPHFCDQAQAKRTCQIRPRVKSAHEPSQTTSQISTQIKSPHELNHHTSKDIHKSFTRHYIISSRGIHNSFCKNCKNFENFQNQVVQGIHKAFTSHSQGIHETFTRHSNFSWV